jgi:hypothetical protein
MEAVARHLCGVRADEPQWFVSLAYATRRCIGLQETLAVLAHATNCFPQEPVILYALACYAVQLGHLHSGAWARLAEAIATRTGVP